MISHDGISFAQSSSSSINGFVQDPNYLNPSPNPNPILDANVSSANKRKRSLPGNPDPEAEVIALSPKSLMATNRFICEVCNKGFQREQNLQLHRRGHNLPWKLKQKNNKEVVKKKVYVCPEKTCVHNDPSRALGDLTGIKKHFSRKHGEKKWKCDKCSKKYAVMSDWKAHSKICGTREYKCDCGTIFSRKDSFITHRAFCDALTEERMRVSTSISPSTMNPNFRANLMNANLISNPQAVAGMSAFSASSHRQDFVGFDGSSSNNNMHNHIEGVGMNKPRLPLWLEHQQSMNPQQLISSNIDQGSHGLLSEFPSPNLNLQDVNNINLKEESDKSSYPQSLISLYSSQPHPQSSQSSFQGSMSATALLQKAAQMGSTRSDSNSTVFATALGAIRSSTSNNFHNNHGALMDQHGYSGSPNQFMMIGSPRPTSFNDQCNNNNISSSNNNNKINTSGGMRDFLGTLGGSTTDNSGNHNGGGGEGERRVLLQDEIAYKLATMAGSTSHHDHHQPQQQQEPYMDLMR